MASSSRCNEYIRVQVPCCFTHTPSSLLYPYWGGGGGGVIPGKFCGQVFFPWAGTGYAGWMVLFPKGGIDLGRGGAYIQTMAFFLQGIVKILN